MAPIAALLVAISGPGNLALARMQTMPSGVAAIFGSFALFLAGTVAATKHRWHKPRME